ncbi:hypothetical protein ACFX5Q_34350 [Mesorhizobium sp. IMUNJ 23033]|uniref:hypothetical protein n=1 Tax=Mesorhizobium sp. IMUNJ 23033 TaxID=3378039 RepID=UPI003850ED56
MSRARVSALDSEILRSAFHKAVLEADIPEHRWREYASQMVREFTGIAKVDPELLEWIVRK